MDIITIPREFAQKDDFVIISKKEYEEFWQWKKKQFPVARLTKREKRAVEESEKELARGEYITLDDLEHELGIAHSKTS